MNWLTKCWAHTHASSGCRRGHAREAHAVGVAVLGAGRWASTEWVVIGVVLGSRSVESVVTKDLADARFFVDREARAWFVGPRLVDLDGCDAAIPACDARDVHRWIDPAIEDLELGPTSRTHDDVGGQRRERCINEGKCSPARTRGPRG